MPSQTYMGVDARRDHSFRIPRPDLSEQLDTSNACHKDKPARWASQALKAWYGHGGQGYQHYAIALHAARNHQADADTKLRTSFEDTQQPAIARATAMAAQMESSADSIRMLQRVLNDSHPLLRRAGLELLEQSCPRASLGTGSRPLAGSDPQLAGFGGGDTGTGYWLLRKICRRKKVRPLSGPLASI